MKIISLILIILIFFTVSFAGKIFVYFPKDLKTMGTKTIGNWCWANSDKAKFIWFFDPIPNIPHVFYVSFKALQTDSRKNTGLASEKIKLKLVVSKKSEKCFTLRVCIRTDCSLTHLGENCRCVEWGPATTHCTVEKISDKTIAISYLKLNNPFKPIEPKSGLDKEIGFTAVGTAKFVIPKTYVETLRSNPFKIVIEWPPLSDEYYLAMSEKEPPKIIFSK